MTALYTPGQAAFWRRRSVRSRVVICIIFAAALLAAVILCCLVTTGNALTLQWSTVCEFTLLGWAGILLTVLVYLPARAEDLHTRGILSGEPETRTGLLTLTDQAFRIPKSIVVRKAVLQTPEETVTLNVDSKRVPLLPSGSFEAEIQTVRKYVTGFRPLSGAPEAESAPSRGRSRFFSRFFSLLPGLMLWAMFSLLLWCWIFSLITDAVPARKVVLYVDGAVSSPVELAVRLEEDLPDGIRMVQVRPFSYAMMDGESIRRADLFILPEGDLETYRDWFAPLPDAFGRTAEDLTAPDGVPLGVPVYDGESRLSVADTFILYTASGAPGQRWYLCFGNQSLHTPGNPDAVDSAAVSVAESLLRLR